MTFEKFTSVDADTSLLFDFFRTTSAYIVFLGHIYQQIIRQHYQSDLADQLLYSMAAYAVMVFFVISGYMVTLSIYRNLSDRNFNKFSSNRFFKDRIIRLYPPLIFASLLSLALYIAISTYHFPATINGNSYEDLSGFQQEIKHIIYSLLFLNNFYHSIPTPLLNPPLWSLSYEFWFYYLAAGIAVCFFNKTKGAMMLIPALVLLCMSDKWLFFLCGLTVWASGAALAIAHQNKLLSNVRVTKTLAICLTVIMAIWGACVFSGIHLIVHGSKYIFGVGFAASIALLIYYQPYRKMSANSLYRRLAASAHYSYTLYIIHWPLILLIKGLTDNWISNSISSLAILSLTSIFAIRSTAKYTAHNLENKRFLHATFRIK